MNQPIRHTTRLRTTLAAGLAVALLAVAAPATTVAQDQPAADGGIVAFLLPETTTARYEAQDLPYFEAKLAELCPDCELLYLNAQGDAATQQRQAENAITNGAQVLTVIPVDAEASVAIVENAKANGVSVISYGRMILNSDVDYAVAFDAFQTGVDQATSLADELERRGSPNGPIVVINGAPGDNNARLMKEGAHSVFDARGIEVAMEYDTPDWSPAAAQQQMDQAITALGPDGFVGVYSMNDGMAGGIIAALKSAGIDPQDRPITGLDAELAALQRIIIGEQYMTQFQDIKAEADASAELAVNLLSGEEPREGLIGTTLNNGLKDVPTHMFRVAPITKENLKAELIDTGYYSAADLCVEPFAAGCEALGISAA